MHPSDLATTSLLLLCACIAAGEHAEQGRGTEACRAWQDAACDHFADQCGAVDRALCDRQYQSVTCRSDEVADNCTSNLRSVQCGGASPNCLLGVVANPEPAQVACADLVSTFCERSMACGISSDKQRCVEQSNSVVPCDRAIGYQLSYERCIEEIPQIACADLALPMECQSVIVAREEQ
jgi:hypothetical protein